MATKPKQVPAKKVAAKVIDKKPTTVVVKPVVKKTPAKKTVAVKPPVKQAVKVAAIAVKPPLPWEDEVAKSVEAVLVHDHKPLAKVEVDQSGSHFRKSIDISAVQTAANEIKPINPSDITDNKVTTTANSNFKKTIDMATLVRLINPNAK